MLDLEQGSGRALLRDDSRHNLVSRYRRIRAATERLCQGLCPEDYVVQSMPDASPAKWHLAHTTWFFETFVIAAADAGWRGSPPEFNYLFNSYYNAVGPMYSREHRGLLSRPTVAEVYDYRARMDRKVAQLMAAIDQPEWHRLLPVIELGLNHEQQHQELILTDLKHMLAQNPLRPVYRPSPIAPARTSEYPLHWIDVEPGLHRIGYCQEDGFCFDNERPAHRQFIERLELASRLVTNGEFRAFIEDGGYRRPELWLDAGWAAVRRNHWRAPLYWEQRDGEWWSFELCGMRPVHDAEPVCHVSFFEADAYARWAGARLPTESEWEAAAADLSVEGNFVERAVLHPVACDGSPGLRQMFGDVWEWTSSAYAPYPGYKPAAGALGEYNGKFMCNQYVLRGGSCASARSHIRRTYRNFFAPDKRWQFSGIRLARDL